MTTGWKPLLPEILGWTDSRHSQQIHFILAGFVRNKGGSIRTLAAVSEDGFDMIWMKRGHIGWYKLVS